MINVRNVNSPPDHILSLRLARSAVDPPLTMIKPTLLPWKPHFITIYSYRQVSQVLLTLPHIYQITHHSKDLPLFRVNIPRAA